MKLHEIKAILRQIKTAIQDANNAANYARVRYLKGKKSQLKQKIKNAKWLGDYLYRLPGRKHWLIRGNHDRKSNSWYIDHGWDWIGENMELKMFNKNNIFSHIPLAMFRIPWNSINIHGHLHGNNHRESEVPLTELHKLLALENTNYQPVLLEKFINAKTI